MAQFGYTSNPSFGFIDSGTHNQAAYLAGAFPSPGGFINQVHVWARTHTGSISTGVWCIWDGSGNLIWSESGMSISTTAGWKNSVNNLSVYVAAGTTIYIGLMVPTANGLYIDYDGNSGHQWAFGSNSTVPGNLAGTTNELGESMGAYVDYTPASVAWVQTGPENAPVWTMGSVFVNTGTLATPVWTPASEVDVNTGSQGSPIWTPGS